MLSDEEKKAIEHLKDYLGDLDLAFNGIITTETAKDYKTILNLIEKQQKEIEELKDIKQKICNEELLEQEYVKENFIHKDKIKAKIEKYKKQQKEEPDAYLCIKVLQSLLEKE